MANSYVEYPTSGTGTNELGQKVFAIPFNYIAIADVGVKGYNGSTWTDLTIAATDSTAKTVELSAAPSTYQKIRVWRNTSTTQLVDFQNGSRLSESDLDTAYQQGLFVAQEVSEGASTATAAGTVDVSLSGNTTVADLDVTGDLDVKGSDIILDADGDSKIEASADDVVAIHTGGSERLRVDSSGLTVDGGTNTFIDLDKDDAGLSQVRFQNAGTLKFASWLNSDEDFIHYGTTGVAQIFYTGGTERFRIATNGDLTATDTSIASNSDERLKENIADYSYDIAKFKQYAPKTFDWKNAEAHNGRTGNRGFIAQHVKAIDENLVGEINVAENSADYGLIPDNLSLTAKLGEKDAMYISVIQQLITRIEALEA